MEKLCIFCEYMETGHEGSDSMGEWDTFYCYKGHFNGCVSVAFLRENILKAANCKDYQQVKV